MKEEEIPQCAFRVTVETAMKMNIVYLTIAKNFGEAESKVLEHISTEDIVSRIEVIKEVVIV